MRPPGAPLVAALVALALLGACGGRRRRARRAARRARRRPPAGPARPAARRSSTPSVLHEARLDLDPAAWQALRDNYLDNQYYAANLTVDGVAVLQVGIRSRGEGSRNEEKPGLKVEFDKYVPAQEYYGYKSLVIDNLTTDASMLRERLSFLVFEAMGIAAPRNAFARLTVNGEYWGLFALVEPVSKPFLEARLGREERDALRLRVDLPLRLLLARARALGLRAAALPARDERGEAGRGGPGSWPSSRRSTTRPTPPSSPPWGRWLDVDRFLTHVAIENALAEGDGDRGRPGPQQLLPLRVRGEEPLRLHPLGQGQHVPQRRPGRSTATSRRTSSPAA